MSQLLDQMRDRIRTLHYSIHTEDAYVLWAKQFIFFHRKRHPLEMGAAAGRKRGQEGKKGHH